MGNPVAGFPIKFALVNSPKIGENERKGPVQIDDQRSWSLPEGFGRYGALFCMTMVPIKYRLYFWNPPILAPAEQVAAGRMILMNGGKAAWLKRTPYLPKDESEAIAGAENWNRKPLLQKAGDIGLPLIFFGAIFAFVGTLLLVPLLLICATILPISLYTRWQAKKRYEKWVADMVDAYSDHAAKEYVNGKTNNGRPGEVHSSGLSRDGFP
jgi:hypothetical protein